MSEIIDAPSLSKLADFEGATFTARHDEGGPVDLLLSEVETKAVTDDWERFSLWFESTGESPLPQACYRLSHSQTDGFDATIAPTMTSATEAETHTYQAVFSRPAPDGETPDLQEALSEGKHLRQNATERASSSGWQPYFVGQVILFSGKFTIEDFYQCTGARMPVNQQATLYAILGTAYGGDGGTYFQLPNLGGHRVPLHHSSDRPLGTMGGTESVELSENQLPPHNHAAEHLKVPVSDADGSGTTPEDNILTKDPHGEGGRGQETIYTSESNRNGSMTVSGFTGNSGRGERHTNMPPYLSMNYQLCANGTWPPRS
ncbi:phage tail protein (plasmid) [Haloferax sp. S1W]|uniref:phage tail protein n=1 Tax=Haloferax sp. S1W TaxID=3377110 RepID=UPI0037C7B0ED